MHQGLFFLGALFGVVFALGETEDFAEELCFDMKSAERCHEKHTDDAKGVE